jgi:hypothetical protein
MVYAMRAYSRVQAQWNVSFGHLFIPVSHRKNVTVCMRGCETAEADQNRLSHAAAHQVPDKNMRLYKISKTRLWETVAFEGHINFFLRLIVLTHGRACSARIQLMHVASAGRL